MFFASVLNAHDAVLSSGFACCGYALPQAALIYTSPSSGSPRHGCCASLTGQLRAPVVHPANSRDGSTPECAALGEGVVCGAVHTGMQIIAGAVCGGIRRLIL